MKKIISLILAGIMLVSCAVVLGSCGGNDTSETTGTGETAQANTADTADITDSDWEAIETSGKLNIGITYYEPMNYYSGDTLVGFDTEYATAVCEKLGIEPNFIEINWDTKETQLKSGNIDCIWNGLTVTEERKSDMAFTESYLVNKQCIVICKEDSDRFTTDTASFADANLTAESGSAGETAILTDGNLKNGSYSGSESQQSALQAVLSGNADAAVVDITLAIASCGNGDFSDLTYVEADLTNEEYAIGFRLGSDMVEKVDEITDGLIEDGTLAAIADKYGMTDLYNEIMG